MAIMMCKGCGTMKAYMDGMCKGCHSLRDSNLFKEDEGVKKAESSSSESGSETTSEHGAQEVRMSLQQLHSVCEAATSLKAHVKKETLVPAWVQSLLTVAHENLEHIEGYFEGKHMKKSVQPPVGAMTPANPRMPAGGVRKINNKPVKPGKQGHAGEALIHRSEADMRNDVEKAGYKPDYIRHPETGAIEGRNYKHNMQECSSCGKTVRAPASHPREKSYECSACAGRAPKMSKKDKETVRNAPDVPGVRAPVHTAAAARDAMTKKSMVPTFPRVTGDSRVLLQHITPDQTVINQITGRDNHQPHSYGLAPSNWEDGNGLRRR